MDTFCDEERLTLRLRFRHMFSHWARASKTTHEPEIQIQLKRYAREEPRTTSPLVASQSAGNFTRKDITTGFLVALTPSSDYLGQIQRIGKRTTWSGAGVHLFDRRVPTDKESKSMKGVRTLSVSAVVLILLVGMGACGPDGEAIEAPPIEASVPVFQPDPNWPQGLPADWEWGQVLGVSVDSRGHVWTVGRSQVAEFDPAGNFLRTWRVESGREDEQWQVIHGLFIDHNDFIWTNARESNLTLKFTQDGEHLLTIGRFDETGGSNDTELMGRPSEVWVDPETNEAYVADGYQNRRVIVFDGETGEYIRHWGAYGERPDDEARATPSDDDPTPAPQFHTLHGITGSRDGLIYVADRTNSRIQVFEKDGTYLREGILRPGTGAAMSVGLSHDPGQEFVYVADGTEHKIWVMRRDNMEVIAEFAREGHGPGELGRPHNLTVDAQGNIYVAEAMPGQRVQKFNFQGLREEE